MDKKLVWVIVCFAVILATATSYLIAQEKHAEQPPQSTGTEIDSSLWGLIKYSGEIGWMIILLSVATLALIIEYSVSLQRNKFVPPDLLQEIEDLFEEESYEEVMETCSAEPGFFTNSIAAALPKIDSGYDAMMASIRNVIEEESIKLQQKISWLQLISSLAPMLGLLGTVTGMVSSFREIASRETSPKPKDLAAGIYQALVTTVEGLLVAIPGILGYFFFRNKLVRITMEISGVIEELFDRFRTKNAQA